MWLFGLPWFGSPRTIKDVRMSYCRFGKKYKKDTWFRVWGNNFGQLSRLCTRTRGNNTFGNAEHKHL